MVCNAKARILFENSKVLICHVKELRNSNPYKLFFINANSVFQLCHGVSGSSVWMQAFQFLRSLSSLCFGLRFNSLRSAFAVFRLCPVTEKVESS